MNVAKERILVVDDMPDNLLVLQSTLEHAGYEVIPALDGSEALNFLRDKPTMVDLVLSDVMMPGLSGYELCYSLRQDPRYSCLPIVLITAKRMEEEDALWGLTIGADDYLTRPIDPRLVVKKISSLLSRKQAADHWQAQYENQRQEIDSREWSMKMLVHDLTSPLSNAVMCASILATDSDLTPRQGALVAKIKKSCLHQHSMMQDILMTAAAQNGKLALNKEFFDLGLCVQEQISLLEEVIASKNIAVQYVGKDHAWGVKADRRLMERVIANLLMNALKYGKPKAPLDIWLGPAKAHPWVLPGEGDLAFVIANEGPVIPLPEQQRIFQPFSQCLANKERTRHAGVGLGLCFCDKVMTLHNGAIGVFSPVPGKENGAAFYFTLPS